MADAGWFPDPTGRFGQRWYDGSAWQDSVVGANGTVIQDAVPDSDVPFPPPAPATPAPSAASGYGTAPGYPAPQASYASPYGRPGAPGAVRYGVGAGLFLGILGLIIVALSLFVLNWTDAGSSRFTDFSSNLRKADSSVIKGPGVHAFYLYGAWLAFVLFALTAVLVLLAGIPVPGTPAGNRYWRVGAAVLAGAGAILHAMTISYIFRGTEIDVGAGPLLGILGWLVVIVAMIFGARRIVGAPVRPY